jgi:hypothetical protein
VKLLEPYPGEAGRRILGSEYDHLARPNLDLSGLPIREADLADTVDQIRVHLNTLTRTLPWSEALSVRIEQVSGHLMAEFEAI